MWWVVAVVVGCGGASPSPAPSPEPVEPAPAPSPEPEPAGTSVDVLGALAAAGACAEDGPDAKPVLRPIELGGAPLLLVDCAFFAYQGTFELWRARGETFEPVRDAAGAAVRGLGVETVDGDRLTWLEKGRGPGDCGAWHAWTVEGGAALELERRERSCDDGARGDPGDPGSWPLKVLVGTVTDLQDGDHGCYVVMGETTVVGGFDLCDRATVGKRARLIVAEEAWTSPDCAGDPECTLTAPTDVVQRIEVL